MRLYAKIKNEFNKFDQIMEVVSGEELSQSDLLNLIEGETEIKDCIFILDELILEKEVYIEAVKLKIETLKARLNRIESSRDSLRDVILAAMDKSGIKSLITPTSTITIKNTPPKVVVNDESKIPAKYFITQDPKLDKRLLANDLAEGGDIDGVVMSNGGITLQVKRT